jgi:hypothetical protein
MMPQGAKMAKFTKISVDAVRSRPRAPKRAAPAPSLQTATTTAFTQGYPHLSRWVQGYGWIEVGRDGYRSSLIRVLDEGGMIWESAAQYPSVDAALQAAEAAVAQWMRDQLGEP